MSRKFLLVISMFSLVGFAVGFYATDVSKSSEASEKCEADFCIALTSEAARPDEISIKVGSSLQFNSADGKPHNMSLGEGGQEHDHNGRFYSGEFGADEGWRTKFDEPGTYYFHDHKNPKINVLVVAYK